MSFDSSLQMSWTVSSILSGGHADARRASLREDVFPPKARRSRRRMHEARHGERATKESFYARRVEGLAKGGSAVGRGS
jgi:hypothetical protein